MDEEASKKLEERFKKIVTEDLSADGGSRWTMIIVVVLVVTIVTAATWYYLRNKDGKGKTKSGRKGNSGGVRILNE